MNNIPNGIGVAGKLCLINSILFGNNNVSGRINFHVIKGVIILLV
jgi:hypothetical protein